MRRRSTEKRGAHTEDTMEFPFAHPQSTDTAGCYCKITASFLDERIPIEPTHSLLHPHSYEFEINFIMSHYWIYLHTRIYNDIIDIALFYEVVCHIIPKCLNFSCRGEQTEKFLISRLLSIYWQRERKHGEGIQHIFYVGKSNSLTSVESWEWETVWRMICFLWRFW